MAVQLEAAIHRVGQAVALANIRFDYTIGDLCEEIVGGGQKFGAIGGVMRQGRASQKQRAFADQKFHIDRIDRT